MSTSTEISILNLPDDIMEHIAQFLSLDDIYACVKASEDLSKLINLDIIWKRFCSYPKNYFKADTEERLRAGPNCEYWCDWRKYCMLQKRLHENWNKGIFSMENTGIPSNRSTTWQRLTGLVDEYGRHWLVVEQCTDAVILDITNTNRIHWKATFEFMISSIKNVGNKIFICGRNGVVEVYQFEPPQYEMICLYKFCVFKDGIFPNNYRFEGETSDIYDCQIVDNILIGYCLIVDNDQDSFLHMWDTKSATKLSPTPTAYGPSYAEFYSCLVNEYNCSQMESCHDIHYLDSNRIIISTEAHMLGRCQISVFSLTEMRIVKVIGQFYGEIRNILVKGQLIFCFIFDRDNCVYSINVYNIYEQRLLVSRDFSELAQNPSALITAESKLIVCTGLKLEVFNITDSGSELEKELDLEKAVEIECCLNSRVLVLQTRARALEVWDIEAGLKLWTLNEIECSIFFNCNGKNFPNKIIVIFEGEDKFSILNFENGGNVIT